MTDKRIVKSNGSLAQLNRASDYGSEGYRFESCANHKTLTLRHILNNGSLAQLNRASDYGSEGYRFESCANHEKGELPAHLFRVYTPHTSREIAL